MPAKSKAQQRFFGVVKGIQKGKSGEGKAKKAADTMSKKDVDDFASTKHKGLPNRVKKETMVRELIKKLVREVMTEMNEGKLKEGKGVDKVLDMANNNSFGKLGGKTVDAMSANLFKTVYDKLTGSNKEKIDKMNEKQLYVFMTKLWTKFGKQVRI